MSEMKFSGDTIVEVHNIETYHSNDNDSITIRRIGTSDYLLFDVNTLNLYNSFSSNKSIAELALINSDHDYQIEDIIEFVDVLLDAGFIKTIDGQKISESLTDNPNLNVEPSKFYSLIFGKVAWTIYIFFQCLQIYICFFYL